MFVPRAVQALFSVPHHLFHNLKSTSFWRKSKNSARKCSFNRKARAACTRGRKTRSRALYFMTHKAQTSIIDFVSLLGSQRILSSILCQGRTPPSRNEFFVHSRTRNWSVDIQTRSPKSTLNLGAVREESRVEGAFLTL